MIRTIDKHVPCVRCKYDLFGHSLDDTCPDCGYAVGTSADPKRLLFSKLSVLQGVRRALLLWVAAFVASLTDMMLHLFFARFPTNTFVHGFVVAPLLAAASIYLYVNFARDARTKKAVVLVIVLMLSGGMAALPFALQVGYQLGLPLVDLSVIPSYSWWGAIPISLFGFHLVTASMIARAPNRLSAWLLGVSPCVMVAGPASAFLLMSPTGVTGTLGMLVMVLSLLLPSGSTLLATTIALRVISRVISERRSMDQEPTLPGKAVVRWVRQPRSRTGLGIALAVLSFPFFLFMAAYFVEAVFGGLWGVTNLVDYVVAVFGLPEAVVLGGIITGLVVLSYLPARLIYKRLAWRRIQGTTRLCDRCGYNLTGNESGQCPECGRKFNPILLARQHRQQHAPKKKTKGQMYRRYLGIALGCCLLLWCVYIVLPGVFKPFGITPLRTRPPPAVKELQAPTSWTAAAAPVENGAGIVGSVLYTGPEVLAEKLSTRLQPNCEAALYSEELVVNEDSTLSNVLVYIKEGLKKRAFAAPSQPMILDARNCRYQPHVLAVQTGQHVYLRNSDGEGHFFAVDAQANPATRLGIMQTGAVMPWLPSRAEIGIPVSDDLHPWMSAYICVIDHPYFNVTNSGGVFRLEDLPLGTYVVESWHEKLGTRQQTVTVKKGELTQITFEY